MPKFDLDEDGQPHKPIYQDRVSRRLVSELLGVCKGMVCDGVITEAKAHG